MQNEIVCLNAFELVTVAIRDKDAEGQIWASRGVLWVTFTNERKQKYHNKEKLRKKHNDSFIY